MIVMELQNNNLNLIKMKTLLKNGLPILFLVISILFIGSSCNNDETPVEPCGGNEFLNYTIDNGTTVNLDAWTAKILIAQGEDDDAFDIWDDDDFYIHSSSTQEGTYQYVVDYHSESGFNLFIPGVIDPFNVGTTNILITFTITQTAAKIDDCIEISFTGSYTDSEGQNHTISGEIQVALDIIHQPA